MPSSKKKKKNQKKNQEVRIPVAVSEDADGNATTTAADLSWEELALDLEDLEVNEVIPDETPAGTKLEDLHPAMQKVHKKLQERASLTYALDIVQGKETFDGVDVVLYQTGVLMCAAILLDYTRASGEYDTFIGCFAKESRTNLYNWWRRLTAAMPIMRQRTAHVPKALDISFLPPDAVRVWNEEQRRFTSVVSSIEITEIHLGYAAFLFKQSSHGVLRITQAKRIEVTIRLTCGICHNPTSPTDKCSHGPCKYTTCQSCRAKLPKPLCPFCRREWQS